MVDLTEAEVSHKIKTNPVRCEFRTLWAARYWANQFGGHIVHNEKTGKIFWYSDNFTMKEIMADLPPHKERPSRKGFILM